MPATIKDVAKRAGVSIATVSKMMNGGNVLEKNRIAIEQAIEDLNYRVNTVARGMKTRKTMTIGVLIPSLADYYGLSVLTSIDKTFFHSGYSAIICDYDQEDPAGAKMKLDLLLNKQVDGIIMQPINVKNEDLVCVNREKTPMVFIDVAVPGSHHDSVTVNNEEIAQDITALLIKKGHSRIGFIAGAPGVPTTDDRVLGYRKALEEAGILFDDQLVYTRDISEETGYEAVEEMLMLDNKPTALFTAAYGSTVGALTCLNEKHLKIPQDISFVGFETLEIARIYHPTLTIGAQPVEEIGVQAANMLLERINQKYTGETRSVRLSAFIQEGDSIIDIK